MFDLRPQDLPGFDSSARDFHQKFPHQKREWIPEGFQIGKVRRPKKDVPPWARSVRTLLPHVVGPRLMRRLMIAQSYYIDGHTAAQIAQELGIKQKAVEAVIYELRHKQKI